VETRRTERKETAKRETAMKGNGNEEKRRGRVTERKGRVEDGAVPFLAVSFSPFFVPFFFLSVFVS
jgi:hypothetical protein